MPRRKVASNRPPHWHVVVLRGGIWTFVGVRMSAKERDDEKDAGRRRVVRRWFNSASAARKAKDKLTAEGRQAMTYFCTDPDWCGHGPPD